MARQRFKQIVYWFMGDRAGRVIVGIWHWLWGIPIEPGGKIAEEVAQEAIYAMQQSVLQLTQSVAALIASYQRAKEKYQSKEKEFHHAEQQAMLAQRMGNEVAARLAMSKAILIERLLPPLQERVQQAEKVVQAAKEKLQQEQEKLETYKVQMQNLKDISEVHEALAAIARTNNTLNIDSARSQFESAQSAIEKRYLRTNAQLEVSENPTERLQADLDRITLDHEITQRLKQLSTSELN
jgi:phage shock protein A